jgi:sugar phosphate permease
MTTATAPAPAAIDTDAVVYRRIAWRIIPFLFVCYIIAFLDRVNVGYAKLQMAADLKFSDEIYGLGAGMFFIGISSSKCRAISSWSASARASGSRGS